MTRRLVPDNYSGGPESVRRELGVWLINLDRSTARRGTMEARLAVLGLPYTRFPAIDGRAEWDRLVTGVDLPVFRRNVGREVLPGEIGCYASHLRVWQALLASQHEAALILEDDVVFHDDFLGALDLALAARKNWDMVKLNVIRAKQPVMQHRLGPYQLNAYVGAFTGMGAYLIKRSFVQRQMKVMHPIRRPFDHALDHFDARTFRHFGLEPFPSHVDDGNQSTITGTSFAAVRKFPWYARLPVYGHRIGNLWRKGLAIVASRGI